MYNIRISVKRCDQYRCCHIYDNTDQLCNSNRAENSKSCSLFRPVILFCTQILTDKGCQSHCKTGHRQKCESLYLGVGTTSCHRHFSKCIYIWLYKDVRDRDHWILKTGWYTILDDLLQHRTVKTNLSQFQTVFFFHTQQMNHTEQCTDKLWNCGCKCCWSDSHAKTCDKENIQNDIDTGRNNQIYQWMASITDRLQNSNKDIVHDNTHRPCKICTEIHNRFREHVRRSSHQYQDLWCQKHSQNCQRSTGHKSKCNRCMDCLLQAVSFFGSVISCNNNTCTHGNAVNKTYHQKNQISRWTDCRQCITS